MPTIELILRDDDNQMIGQRSMKKYSLNLSSQRFDDIEGAVENFKKTALPDIELDLLESDSERGLDPPKKRRPISV